MSSLIILPAFILLNVCLPRLNLYVCLLSPSLNMMPFLCKSCSTQSNIRREARFSAFCSSGFRCLFSSFYIENGKKGTYFSHPGVIPFFLPAFVIKCVCCVSPSVERFRFSGGPLLEHSLWHCIFFRVFFIIRTSGTGMKGVTWSRTNIPGSRYLRVYNTFKCYADDVACAQQYACLNSYKPYISSSIR